MDTAWAFPWATPAMLAAWTALGVGVPALAWALHLRHRLQQLQRGAQAQQQQWQELFDTLDIGLMVFDAEDRLLQWNAGCALLYPALAGQMQVGQPFEDLLRRAVALNLVPEATGREDDWITQRMAQHRQPRGPLLQRMADGRWRRTTERYLAGGGMLSYSIDVTRLVAQGEGLEQARRDAEAARLRLLEVIEVLPASLEWFDADDRLVLANGHSRQMFPLIQHLFAERPTFETLVRANHAAGGMPKLKGTIDDWLAMRLPQRRQAKVEQLLDVSGRWVRLYERRTGDGGNLSVRLDVTEEVAQRAAAEAAQRQLQDAIEALPDGFALYDADDRLILCNQRYRTIYRESAPAMQPGTRFMDVLRYGLAQGQYPQAAGREQAWLAERLRAHREPGPPVLQELPGNRWLRIDERRTRSGGVAGVRTDVTALVRREQTLLSLNQQLDQANARLAELLGQDAETGAAHRSAFGQALQAEWRRAQRHGAPLAVLVLAVTTDAAPENVTPALRGLAAHLASCVRRPGDLLARVDIQRLALLLPHTSTAALTLLAQRCAQGCSAAVAGWPLYIGGASSDTAPPPESPETLLAQALAALQPVAPPGPAADPTDA